MTIDANVRTPEQLFQAPIRYMVPAYQRRYIWNRERQWEPLWEDVKRLADSYLELTDNGTKSIPQDDAPRHFLGAVVLQQEVTATGAIGMRRVIDGQQRLTTLQILLDAVQEVYENQGLRREANLLEVLVLNGNLYVGDDPDERFKVWPTLSDQQDFRFAMRNDATGERPDDSLIIDAHDYFKDEVEDWLSENGEVKIAPEALRLVLSQMLQVVVIDLDAQAEPQVIFETLNARGTPLMQADLVRNYLIFKARAEGLDEDGFNQKWLIQYNDDWWQEEEQYGALRRARFEQFLYYWVTMRTGEIIRVDEVFNRFQRIADDHAESSEGVAASIREAATIYRHLQDHSSTGPMSRWNSYLTVREKLNINVDAPLLLWLHTSGVDAEQLDVAHAALESWFVRRQVWGRISAGVNRVVVDIVNELKSNGTSSGVGQLVVGLLKNQAHAPMRWTTDEEFVRTLVSVKSYGRIRRSRLFFLLERLEVDLRRGRAEELDLPDRLQIEHVMPKSWQQHWPLTGETTDAEPDERRLREHWVDCLGNLTLVTRHYNLAASNHAWAEKRDALSSNSVLFLNKDIVEHGKDSWAVADVRARGQRLAARALEIWPGPDKF